MSACLAKHLTLRPNNMRFERLRLHEMGTYRDDVDLDFSALAGPLIAICGPNGAGKTTLLELLPGTLFRQTPTRGTLGALARTRDAWAEVRFVNGKSYTIRQTVDAISGKGEALVLDELGNPVLDSAKVRQFDEWAALHLVHPDVLYSSAFAVQGQRGFIDLRPAERKQVLCRVLGLERLERMATEARERARAHKSELDVLRARLGDLEDPDLAALRAASEEARRRTEVTADRLRGARVALERATAAQDDVRRAQEIAEQRRAAGERLEQCGSELADLGARLGNNRALLERAAEIHEAIDRIASLETGRAAARERLLGAAHDMRATASAFTAANRQLKQAEAAIAQVRARVTRIEARLTDGPKVKRVAAQLPAVREKEVELGHKLDGFEREVQAHTDVVVTGKDQRIAGLRTGLEYLADSQASNGPRTPPVSAAARAVLDEDDALAVALERAPAELERLRGRIADHRGNLHLTRSRLLDLERLAAQLPAIESAEAELTAGYEEIADAEATQRTAQQAVDEAGRAHQVSITAHAQLTSPIEHITKNLQGLANYPALLTRLDQATARIEELSAQQTAALERQSQVTAELAALPDLQPGDQADLLLFEESLAIAQTEHDAAQQAVTAGAIALENANVVQHRRRAIEAEIATASDELSDWTRLGQDLGRDGLQALELDAALPALNDAANDLLHHCHGPRFTVELRTDRLSADGKRVLEELDVRVIDTVEGRDALAETYSGGECVIVGEAVALALTMLACQRSGFERPTLVRDESGAALDAQCAPQYVAMLRRAAQLIGADRVLFVTHNPELQELADSRITITADHRVEVGGPS
jgi:exonuclease SbcC